MTPHKFTRSLRSDKRKVDMAESSAQAISRFYRHPDRACFPHLFVESSKLEQTILFYQKGFGAEFLSPPRYSLKRKASERDDSSRRLVLAHFRLGVGQFFVSEMPEDDEKDGEEDEKDGEEEEKAGIEEEEKTTEDPVEPAIITNIVIRVLTDNLEETVEKALSAGGRTIEAANMPGIGQFTTLADPAGFVWGFGDTNLVIKEQAEESTQTITGESAAEILD
ncbi:hypothetical protein KP509_14G037300 [Ceratopteris richardii]|uniref:VOC domain-containing protein n=1 Tax=Ceratopteris richardii TaxID=49495 RepID=A0A8T2T771_CERRI|nr:hypothetical protein KP509_14G037300 [Ceratopteris richardii]